MKRFIHLLRWTAICFLVLMFSGAPRAFASFDNPTLYEQLQWYWYRAGNTALLTCADGSTASSGGSNGTTDLDGFLRALAYQESGGNPTSGSPGSHFATGKYQYEYDTWHSHAQSYYSPADKYDTARDAPEAYQDAVAYIEYTVKSIQLKGDVAEMAVSHIYPTMVGHPDQWPTFKIGNNPTAQEYVDSVLNILKSGKASSIPMKENDAPDFKTYLAKAGSPAQLTISSGAGSQASTCGTCNIGELNTAMSYAWPTYHDAPFTDFKPVYQAAVDAAQSKGMYVGGDQKPGMDCGGFVTLTMRNSGADPNYNDKNGPTTAQQDYLNAHPELYQNLGQKTSTDGLEPGDIGINSEHTFIYAGDRGFSGYNAISASICGSGNSCRAPMASTAYFSNSAGLFTFYRLKCVTTGG